MAETRTASPVSWFEVHSPDTTRAKAFYGELFGWTFSEAGPDYSLVGLGDDAPIGGGIAGAHRGPGADGDHLRAGRGRRRDVRQGPRARRQGPHAAADQDEGLTFAYVADPDFGVLGVWTPPAAA